MPRLPVRRRRPSTPPVASDRRPVVVVLGDLMLDVVLTPDEPLRGGTDVPGRVALRQGGSAANTARWLARLGARVSLVCAVGRDPAGRALVDGLRAHDVRVRAVRVRGHRTGRIGVVVGPGGERSFVADRGAADRLAPADLRSDWFDHAELIHLPAYSLLGSPLDASAADAIRHTRAAGGAVSIDLASVGPLVGHGIRAARQTIEAASPELLFATAGEAAVVLGGARTERLVDLAPLVVVKRGAKGASVFQRTASGDIVRFEVAAQRVTTVDTTGAGDAFDAGFIAAWLDADPGRRMTQAVLHRAAIAGHRAAVRQLTAVQPELGLA
jgi:sugar/nucleoside kinase (ribokinase family)